MMWVRYKSEKDAELAQKLGQLQPFIAVFPQQRTGQLASSLGQPNTFPAPAVLCGVLGLRMTEDLLSFSGLIGHGR
jgi:hypothetical protein